MCEQTLLTFALFYDKISWQLFTATSEFIEGFKKDFKHFKKKIFKEIENNNGNIQK